MSDAPQAARPGRNAPLNWLLLSLVFLATFALIRGVTGNRAAGRKADYSWKVTDLDGRPVDLASYRGNAVFLNVWATWCGPCRQEMPSIARLAAEPKLKDVAFLCVSVDNEAEEVKAYVAETRPPMTILHARGPTPAVFATDGIPATFLIAPDGRIARAEVGSRDWDTPEFVALLDRLAHEAR